MLNDRFKKIPLCVDMDGTLLKTDSLYELFLLLFKKNPLYCILAVTWLMKSKAHFKAEITNSVQLSAEGLPYNEDIIEYIKAQDPEREILLVTGSNKKVADSVAEHLGIFDEVIASDENINLTGKNKREYLVERFGGPDDKGQDDINKNGFEYIGNEKADMPVWEVANKVSVVSQDNTFLREVRQTFNDANEFNLAKPSLKNYLKGIRIHQWVKN
ncbi:MAG: hypothetical protein KAI17_10400, partial [Thiotrichaceae bacterium]|nr:hypothetical protein [Thiotrichaceae bacterium]